MEPWYQTILCGGRAEQQLQKIANYVRNQRLSQEVPAVYLEKKAHGQFYVFLAVATDGPTNKSSALNTLIEMLGQDYQAIYEYDEIKRMVSGKIETKNFARRLNYTIRFDTVTTDPFDLAEPVHSASRPITHQTESFNKLLYWLSTTGKGTWTNFQATCKVLGLSEPGRVLRRLRLLGHLEVGDNGQYWQVCPPCLVQSGPLTYFLAGQRNGSLLARLKGIAGMTLNKTAQPDEAGPETIHLTFTDVGAVEQTCRELGLHGAGRASQHHANVLPDVAGLKMLYPSVTLNDTTVYRIQRWEDNLPQNSGFDYETGFYRLTHRLATENDQLSTNFYYDAEDKTWRRGDWYGLRYLAQIAEGETIQALYDPTEGCLALPYYQRWPDLYERALVLSSGKLPERNKDWLYYSDITLEVAQLLTTKLNATLNYKES